MNQLLKIAAVFERINEAAGKLASYFTAALVLLIGVDVLARYLFDTTFIWVLELEIYFFAIIFLLGAGYAFKHDRHVRVDVFYANWSIKRKAWVNLLGGLFFLLPWCVVILQVAYRYAAYSFSINESSAQQGGLPFLYILKFIIFLGFVLLTLQAVASIIKSVAILNNHSETLE